MQVSHALDALCLGDMACSALIEIKKDSNLHNANAVSKNIMSKNEGM
jgi:hypothetical protein